MRIRCKTIFNPSMNNLYDYKIKLTIHFQFTQLIECKFRIVARIRHTKSTFVVVNDVTSVNRTVDSLVLWWRTVHSLYFMETKIAILFGGGVGNVKEKTSHSWCVCRRTLMNNQHIYIWYEKPILNATSNIMVWLRERKKEWNLCKNEMKVLHKHMTIFLKTEIWWESIDKMYFS